MKHQRNVSQRKEQDETPEEQLQKVEVGRLLGEDFRVMTAKMIQDLGEKTGRYRKYLTKTWKN